VKLQPKDLRVHKFLERHLHAPVYRFDLITDPRARRGRRWPLVTLLWAALYGMMAGCRSLRQVEDLTDEMGPTGRGRVPGRVPDTTLYDLVPRLHVEELRQQVRWQVKTLWRDKCLDPQGLPCGVVSIDGKGLGALDHDAGGNAQKAHRAHDGTPYWLGRVLRAVLTSACAKPCLDQMAVPTKTNEMGAFATFFAALMAAYGGGNLFEIITTDAGMTSKHNADLVHAANKAYVMALKGPQPELYAEAQRLLLPLTTGAPCAQTWDKAQGKQIRRSLYRTCEMAGYHDWTHLRQVWLVRQESRDKDGRVTIEDRYFVTNLPSGRLQPAQILQVVRGHWGIENDCFWSLDAQFGEDALHWVTTGRCIEVLGLLRLMAYNLLQLCRKRHLRPRPLGGPVAPPPSWQQMFRWVWQALRLPLPPPACPMPAD
jgi:predicted transposase YbfD/YdcC